MSNNVSCLVDHFAGNEGTAKLVAAYKYATTGMAFNVWSENKEGADISEWGGFELEYASTATYVNIPWSKFAQESAWSVVVNKEEALKKISTIGFKFVSNADFHIQTVGSLGSCYTIKLEFI